MSEPFRDTLNRAPSPPRFSVGEKVAEGRMRGHLQQGIGQIAALWARPPHPASPPSPPAKSAGGEGARWGSIAKKVVPKLLLLVIAIASLAMSDYDADLARLQKQADELRAAPKPDPAMLAAILYRRASMTADFVELQAAEKAIDEAIRIAPTPDLLLLRASFNFKMHRLQRAKQDLAQLIDGNTGEPIKTLSAQIAMQEGDYATARNAYRDLANRTRTWDSIASLAYYESVTGEPAAADRLYAQAEDELTAKEMRSYAWVEVQRGLIDFDHARYPAALIHYQRANRAYSGYWLVEEHIAEVLDRLGRTAESVALYQKIIGRTHNPEYIGALAVIIARTDRDAARKLDAEAATLYDAQLHLYPEAAGGHLIRHLLTRDDTPPSRLVDLAQQNVDLRPNGEAKLLLAKSYWKAGRTTDTQRILAEVRQTPWRTPELMAFEREVGRGGR
jgi:tetratricopeptide (TPR) repeat protein